MAGTTIPLPSQNEPIIDRTRKWSPRWWPVIQLMLKNLRAAQDDLETVQEVVTTLETSVGDNTTSIEQVQTSINGIEARWGVTINTNGQVVGLVRLDALASQSEFTVLADKFIVAQPSGAGPKQVFVIGNVAGVPAVGLAGNMLIDGAIIARHLSVPSLDAVSGNMGTLTVGKILSPSGRFLIDATNETIRITT